MSVSSGIRLERALWVAAKLGVADHLGPDPTPVEALAAAVDANPDALYRVLRALAAVGIFSEARPRWFVPTFLSGPLRSDACDSVRQALIQHGDEPEWKAWCEILHSVRTGEPAFAHVWKESPWRHFEDRRDRMTQVSRQDSTVLAKHKLFAGARCIVDVAGGEGDFLAAVLAVHPRTRGILFDRPQIVASAVRLLERAEVSARCTIVGGDMFECIPRGGDLYILKRALHDWDDAHAHQILRSVHAAMEGRGRLVILTAVISPGNEPSSAKFGDLALMVMLGGRHRTEAEFRALLAATGFWDVEIVALRSTLWALVAVPCDRPRRRERQGRTPKSAKALQNTSLRGDPTAPPSLP